MLALGEGLRCSNNQCERRGRIQDVKYARTTFAGETHSCMARTASESASLKGLDNRTFPGPGFYRTAWDGPRNWARAWHQANGGRPHLQGANHQKTYEYSEYSHLCPSSALLPCFGGQRNGCVTTPKVRAVLLEHISPTLFSQQVAVLAKDSLGAFPTSQTGVLGKDSKSSTKTLQAHSSAALLRAAGLDRVLDAHRRYRLRLMTGDLGVSSSQAYKLNNLNWLAPSAS